MCSIASTTGTIPGILVTSMCSMVLVKYALLSAAASVAFIGLVLSVLSCDIAKLLSIFRSVSSQKRKNHHGPLRFPTGRDRHCGPGWLCTTAIFNNYTAASRFLFALLYKDCEWN